MSKKKHKVIDAERVAFVTATRSGASRRRGKRRAGGHGKLHLRRDPGLCQLRLQQGPRRSYAIVAYRTGLYEVRYPREYMAALLTSVLDNSDKVAEYIAECRAWA
jgi:DNA polymerase-3 subunit alpha